MYSNYRVAGEKRLIAIEDSARYRDALGIPLPPGIPSALLEPVAQPVLELLRRFARTHGPFTLDDVAHRFALDQLKQKRRSNCSAGEDRVVEGGFRPGGLHQEWCDTEVLRLIRRKSLAKLRQRGGAGGAADAGPLPHPLARLLAPRRGMDALLDTIENLQGAPIAASLLESSILPARIANYNPGDLDTLIAAGEVSWAGVEPLGERDGRLALYLADKMPLLAPAATQSRAAFGKRIPASRRPRAHGSQLFHAAA